MANTIKLKRSNSAGAIPSSLNPGELAVNTADRRLTMGNNSSVVVCPAAGVMTGTDYPLNPLTGQIFFNTTSSRLYVYNGSSWSADNAVNGGHKNFILNGDFRICQRYAAGNISVAANTYAYHRDRWTVRTAASAASTLSLQTGPTTEAGISHCLRVQRDSGQTGYATVLEQALRTEDIYKMHGRKVTLSFWARKGSGYSASNSVLTAHLIAGTGAEAGRGTGAYTSESYPVNGQSTILTENWNRYSFTSSAVIGTTITQMCANVQATWNGTAGASDYFEVTGVQLEVGEYAIDWEKYQIDDMFARCQAYFQTNYAYGIAPGSGSSAGYAGMDWLYITASSATFVSHGKNVVFPVRMRTSPAVTLYSPNTGTAGKAYDFAGKTDANASVGNYCDKGFYWSTGYSATAAPSAGVSYAADAEL